MNRYLVQYNNGHFEALASWNATIVHLIEIGIVKVLIDIKEGKAWVRNEEGDAEEITIPQISGL